VRTGTFVRGVRDVFFRVELGEYAGGAARVQLVRPDGSIALDESAAGTPDGVAQGHGQAAFDYRVRARFDALGTWRLRFAIDGITLADGRLRVVGRAAQATNRAPNAVTVTGAHDAAQCVVGTSLVARAIRTTTSSATATRGGAVGRYCGR
jgi:hypothetical protein